MLTISQMCQPARDPPFISRRQLTTRTTLAPQVHQPDHLMIHSVAVTYSYLLDAQSASQSAPSNAKSTPGRSRGPVRRVPVHTTRLEALDDYLGPLGPLGDNAPTPLSPPEQPPIPPQKEQTLTMNQRHGDTSSRVRDIMNPDFDDIVEPITGRPRQPPPVQPAQGEPIKRDTQPSISIEQAAKPTFDITVGDPHKVGDLTSSHIVYQVRSRVRMSSNYVILLLIFFRPPQKPIDSQSSPLPAATGTSCGCITHFTPIIQELLFLHHRRSKLSVDLTAILSNRDAWRWRRC